MSNNNEYYGTTPINIPNAKKCHANHGLVTAVPCEDMTFGIFKRKNQLLNRFKNILIKNELQRH